MKISDALEAKKTMKNVTKIAIINSGLNVVKYY